MTENCIVIFLNAPQPDKIDPEFANALGPERACHIYTEMAKDVFARAKQIRGVYTFLVYEKTPRYPNLLWLDSNDPGFLELKPQTTAAERRIFNAVQWAAAAGAVRIAVLNIGSPGMPREWIEKAFSLVSSKNVVVGPARGGGIYLFAACPPYPQVFEGYSWPSECVFDEIIERVKRLRYNVEILPEFYSVRDEKSLREWSAIKDRTSLLE